MIKIVGNRIIPKIGVSLIRLILRLPERTLLILICLLVGIAAGISAINAPVAGVLFAVEVVLVNMSVTAFIPLLLASATAAIVSRILFQGQLFGLITNQWNLNAIPVYIILGVLAGLFTVLIIRQSIKINAVFGKISNKWMYVGIGGVILSSLIFIFLPLLILLFVKIYATGITISAGGNGGIFAPSLFMGAFLGYLISNTLNINGLTEPNVVNFSVVGMACVLSGVIKIPLLAVFLMAEITRGYVLFVPLMIVPATSYFISSYFEHKSIYTRELELKA
jgi:CIC family chloride channel protein